MTSPPGSRDLAGLLGLLGLLACSPPARPPTPQVNERPATSAAEPSPSASSAPGASGGWAPVPAPAPPPEPPSRITWARRLGSSGTRQPQYAPHVWSEGASFALHLSRPFSDDEPDQPLYARHDAEGKRVTPVARFDVLDLYPAGHAPRSGGGMTLIAAYSGPFHSGKVKIADNRTHANLLWLSIDGEGKAEKAVKLGQANPGVLAAEADPQGNFYVASLRYADSPTLRAGAIFSLHDLELRKMDPAGRVAWKKNLGNGGYNEVSNLVVRDDGVLLSYQFQAKVSQEKPEKWLESRDTRGNVRWRTRLLAQALGQDREGTVYAFNKDERALGVETFSADGKPKATFSLCCGTRYWPAVAASGAMVVLLESPLMEARLARELAPLPASQPVVVGLSKDGKIAWVQPLSPQALSLPEGARLLLSDRPIVVLADGSPLVVVGYTTPGEHGAVAVKLMP